eukprot:CAMPEP_0178974816 /NCGR_PEP_ID=MMETSP0789-20121207/22724_1 /TAXON_ID=3005 /ORGANISM="Rhizosolenia setigera, Strain CCMP 1694" /LENGTH=664 /DNA_ID=CAMNT_0020663307 /DNA_START=68 /DNA_END=2059 /DNA_ORIENTATION=+
MPGGYPPRTHPIHPGQTRDQSDIYTHGHGHPNIPSGTYPISSQHPLHPHPPIPLPPNHPAYQHPQNHPVSVMAISRPSHHRNTPSHHSNMDELNNGMSNMKMSNNNWQKAWYSDDSDSDEEERQPNNDAYNNNNNNKNNNTSQQNVGTTNNFAPIQPGSVTNRVDPSLYPPNSSIEQADQQHHQHQLQLEMQQHQQQQQIQSRPTDRVVLADPGNHNFFEQSQEVFPVKLSESMFSQKRVLGKGSFGKVVLVQKESGPEQGKLFAMKILRKSHLLRRNQIERTMTERKVLSIVNHPFIMRLHFAFQTKDKLFFVLEYCAGGELFFHLSRFKRFPVPVARFYAAEILLAIGHLHRRGIIFRDLKPENVLLNAKGHVKLGDFGLSKDNIRDPCKGATSMEYMAPEVITRRGHGFCVDYWGLGMLVYEMMTSLPPWYTQDREKLERNLLYAPLEMPTYVQHVPAMFVAQLLQRDPRRRLGVNGIKSVMLHPFFKDIDWKALSMKRIQPPIKPCEGWKTGLSGNPSVNNHSNGHMPQNSSSTLTDNEIDGVTSNFAPEFTRMPVHTEDHNIDRQYSGSEYGEEDHVNSYVGFTFDEIDQPSRRQTSNNATTSRTSRASRSSRAPRSTRATTNNATTVAVPTTTNSIPSTSTPTPTNAPVSSPPQALGA